jgi:hypothetical protein
MAFAYPNQVFKTIGEAEVCSRRACSYTPAATTILRQISIIAKKTRSSKLTTTAEIETIYWEIRSEVATHKPGTDSSTLLSSGSFDFRYETIWKIDRPVYYTITLPTPLTLAVSTNYYLVIKTGADVTDAKYVFAWATTVTSTTYTPVATTYDSAYASAAWSTGAAVMNLTLYVSDYQAGVNWDMVINGKGYMAPDGMKGWAKETISSGLAQSRGGQSEYSQMRYPYSSLSQSNWTSGSGQLILEDQASFLYSLSLDTRIPNQMIIGPEVFSTGISEEIGNYYLNGGYAPNLPRTDSGENQNCDYLAQCFLCPAGGITVNKVGIFCSNDYGMVINRTLEVAIFSDVMGVPTTKVSTGGVDGWGPLTPSTNVYMCTWADAGLDATLVAGTYYWIVVRTVTDGSHYGPGFRIVCSASAYTGGYLKASNGGTSWAAATLNGDSTVGMYFRVNFGVASALNGDVKVIKYGEISANTLVRGAGTETFMAAGGKRVYKWNTSTSIWESISTNICGLTAAGVASVESQYAIQDGIFFNGKFIATQGYDYPMRVWDGTNWTSAGSTNILTAGENGAFTTVTTNWTADGSTLSSVAGGQSGNCLKIVNSAAAVGGAIATITTEALKWYEVIFYAKDGAGGTEKAVKPRVGTGAGWADLFQVSSGVGGADAWVRYSLLFKATGTTTFLSFYVDSTTTSDYTLVDTVSVVQAPVGKVLHIGKGYMWASASPNTVRKSNNTTTWSAELTVGESIYAITAFANFQGALLIGKEDGIWSVDTNDLTQEYLIFREHADPNNCIGMCVWSGMLFIPVQNSIWRWQGSQYKEIGPTDKRNGPTKDWPNKISRMASTAPYLFASTTPINATGWGGLLAYDGMGWHHITATNYTGRTNYAICVTSELGSNENRIWWGEGSKINYIKLAKFTNNRYDWTAATYNMSGGWFVSSWFDGGVKDAMKYWNRLTIIADIPANTTVDVLCAKDGEDWSTVTTNLRLGTLTSASMTDNGEYVLMFPDGMAAKNIQIILGLNTTSLTATPRVKAFNLEAAVRQPPVYSYTARLLLADNITKMDGSKETSRKANDMEGELEIAEASEIPINVSWPDKTVRGFISFQRLNTDNFSPNGTQTNRWDRVVQLSVIEAT